MTSDEHTDPIDVEQLIAKAKARSEATATPADWGRRIILETDSSFVGVWRGVTVDEENDRRPVFLLHDQHGEPCFSRHYAALGREIDKASPEPGDTVALFRGEDYVTADGNSGFSYGVAVQRSTKPKPRKAKAASSGQPATDDADAGIPFRASDAWTLGGGNDGHAVPLRRV